LLFVFSSYFFFFPINSNCPHSNDCFSCWRHSNKKKRKKEPSWWKKNRNCVCVCAHMNIRKMFIFSNPVQFCTT
jgi:hypothetical protein